jgi:hypothetical protein
MRKRWQVLSAIASFGVMTFLAIIARYGFHPNIWVLLGLGGFAAACGVSLWAAITDYHGRWPAAVALVTFAPFAERLLGLLGEQRNLWRNLDFLAGQLILCSVLTVVAAVVILLMKVPPKNDQLPTARLT